MNNEHLKKFFLGGLNLETTEESLSAYFSQWGTITDCIVMRFPDTEKSRGFGFLTYSTQEEADACFEANPHTLDGTNIEVKRAQPKGGRGNERREDTSKKIFIGGLNPTTSDEALKAYFEQFGEVTDCIVMKYKDSDRSRGFGFVTYSTQEMVDAVQQNRPHTIDGSKVETKRACPRDDASRGGGDSNKSVKKIFIGGFKTNLEDNDIQEYFSSFGNITSAKQVLEKGTGKKLGFGFVEFDDYDPVDKIIIQGQHQISGFRVDVRKAIPKEEIGGGGFGGGRGGRGGQKGGWGGGGQSYGSYGAADGGYQAGYGGGYGGAQETGWGSYGAQETGWGTGYGTQAGGYMSEGSGWGGGYAGANAGGGGAMRVPMGGNRTAPYSVGGGRGMRGRGRGAGAGAAGGW